MARGRNIFRGTPIGFTEAPHLYKRGGYYHLVVAEGGTAWGHAVTMARSRTIDGPYELHPDTYVLTARDRPDCALQRAGHASLVDTPADETFMVYLCGRPLPNRGRCVLGRETAIQQMVWSQDGWLRTGDGDGVPQVSVPAPNLPSHPIPALHHGKKGDGPHLPERPEGCFAQMGPVPFFAVREDFDSPELPIDSSKCVAHALS